MNRATWRVGELAERTGLTVRALHHYHEIGLLVPSLRTHAGHRCYAEADVQRLHRILALRGFGFSLAEIGQVLDGGGTACSAFSARSTARLNRPRNNSSNSSR
ncbi:MAG TPA: MerR family transcriptional regulator [Pseudonocardiaceae bacterium]